MDSNTKLKDLVLGDNMAYADEISYKEEPQDYENYDQWSIGVYYNNTKYYDIRARHESGYVLRDYFWSKGNWPTSISAISRENRLRDLFQTEDIFMKDTGYSFVATRLRGTKVCFVEARQNNHARMGLLITPQYAWISTAQSLKEMYRFNKWESYELERIEE